MERERTNVWTGKSWVTAATRCTKNTETNMTAFYLVMFVLPAVIIALAFLLAYRKRKPL
ncbi:MAG TPA: LPXTG cell wall anchor domain-containing protein [Calditrichaeota bacterium]|nr:LPXTG cell wall anchor domain-containing protein [Calditrichota bacterium]